MGDPADDGDGAGRDDWETHWTEYADTAEDNPAQAYRRALIARALAGMAPLRTVVDIGSGQGDLLADLHQQQPDLELLGLELSGSGIDVARAKVPTARFEQVDLLAGAPDTDLDGWADAGICSEVLEHVDEPEILLRNGATTIAPGGRVLITVPGGPRTAFDRHIGHRRHYDTRSLRDVIRRAGLEPELVAGHGLPFFNLYKLVVLARGERLIADVAASEPPSRLATAVMAGFRAVLRPGLCSSRHGWQLLAVARKAA